MKIENLEIKDDNTILFNGKTYRAESEPVLSDMERNVKEVKYTVEYCKKNKIAIQCLSQKEWGKVSEILDYEWNDAIYTVYNNQSAITTHLQSYESVSYFKSQGYTIITAERFISDNHPATVEQAEPKWVTVDNVTVGIGEVVYFITNHNEVKYHKIDKYFDKLQETKWYSTNEAAQKVIDESKPKWQKDWEVMEFRANSCDNKEGSTVFKLYERNGYYRSDIGREISLDDCLYITDDKPCHFHIHAIRNKQSGEEFTVGDNYTIHDIGTKRTVESIMIHEGELFINGAHNVKICHPYTEPALPTLQEVFKKVQPRWFVNDLNEVEYVTDTDIVFTESSMLNCLSTESQCKQLQAYIALRNIADYYNGEVGWINPNQAVSASWIIIFRRTGEPDVVGLQTGWNSPMEVQFKSIEHAENAISILKEAGLLNALKG